MESAEEQKAGQTFKEVVLGELKQYTKDTEAANKSFVNIAGRVRNIMFALQFDRRTGLSPLTGGTISRKQLMRNITDAADELEDMIRSVVL